MLALVCFACEQGKESESKDQAEQPDDGGCTVPKASFHIRNGEEAGEDDYPFVGMLYAEDVEQKFLSQVRHNRRVCSASVVCPNVVLTAAHCFLDKDDPRPETYTFYSDLSPGEDPKDKTKAPRGTEVRIMSPEGQTGRKDLALLKLDTDLDIEPAKLWTKSLPQPPKDGGPKVTIVGYGSTETEDDKDVDAGTKRTGSMRYKGQMKAPTDPVIDGMGTLYPAAGLSASASKTQNACGGDSGGAAVLDDALYGVIAKVMTFKDGKVQAEPTCDESNISFIAEVPRQLEWIKEYMAEYCSDGGEVKDFFGPSGKYEAAKEGDDKPIAEELGPTKSTSSEETKQEDCD